MIRSSLTFLKIIIARGQKLLINTNHALPVAFNPTWHCKITRLWMPRVSPSNSWWVESHRGYQLGPTSTDRPNLSMAWQPIITRDPSATLNGESLEGASWPGRDESRGRAAFLRAFFWRPGRCHTNGNIKSMEIARIRGDCPHAQNLSGDWRSAPPGIVTELTN